MFKFIKLSGSFPENVAVLNQSVAFNLDGVGVTEDPEIAEILRSIPGYEEQTSASEASEDAEAEIEEDELEVKASTSPAKKRPAIKAKR